MYVGFKCFLEEAIETKSSKTYKRLGEWASRWQAVNFKMQKNSLGIPALYIVANYDTPVYRNYRDLELHRYGAKYVNREREGIT